MKIYSIYKHIHCTDVAFEPWYIEEYTDFLYLQGIWWNVAGQNDFTIIQDKIKIQRKDLDKWEDIK